MSADYVVADAESTFCHGNLVRGVCPIGMFSKTLTTAAGLSRSLHIYLSNDTLDAATAKRFRLVHETAAGVKVTQSRAREVATMLAAQEEQARVLLAARLPYDAGLVAAEAARHARCLLSNGGYHHCFLPDSHAAQAMKLSFDGSRASPAASIHSLCAFRASCRGPDNPDQRRDEWRLASVAKQRAAHLSRLQPRQLLPW